MPLCSKKMKLCRGEKNRLMSNTCHCRFIWCHLELKQTKEYANHSFTYSIIIPSVSVTVKSSLTTLGGMANCPLLQSRSRISLFHMALSSVSHLLLFNQTIVIRPITEWTQYCLVSLRLAKIRLINKHIKPSIKYKTFTNQQEMT